MKRRNLLRACLMALLILVGTACGGGAPNATPQPGATSFEEYSVAICAAWDSLFRAVGNPDTGSGSVLSKSLDDAMATGDSVSAERLAVTIRTELEAGRRQVAVAGGWQPAKPVTAQLDRVFTAFEAMIAAKAAAAKRTPNAVPPQTVFEQAGGVEAWTAMFEAYRAVPRPSGSAQTQCPNVPVSP